MTGPNLLGRRADLEVTELRIDSHSSVPERHDFLKSKDACHATIKAVFIVCYREMTELC